MNWPETPTLSNCRVCGVDCGFWLTHWDEELGLEYGVQPWCPEHCEDHDFEYDPYRRAHTCKNCDAEREYEPSEDDVSFSFTWETPIGTPLSQLSGRPGHPGYDKFCRIAASWGYD